MGKHGHGCANASDGVLIDVSNNKLLVITRGGKLFSERAEHATVTCIIAVLRAEITVAARKARDVKLVFDGTRREQRAPLVDQLLRVIRWVARKP